MNIELDCMWNREEFLRASYANFRRRRRTIAYRAFSLLMVFMIASSPLFIFEQGSDSSHLIVFILALYWFVLHWPLQRFFLSRQFEKHAEKDADVHWLIGDEGFKGGSTGSQSEFFWDAVTSVEATNERFPIYRYPIFHWLPLASFRSHDDIVGFETLAQQKVRKYVSK